MTAIKKAASRGLGMATDRSRLRGRAGALVNYIWRAQLQELAHVEMMTSVDSYHTDLLRYVRRDDQAEEVAAKLVRNILCQSPDAIAEEIASLLEAVEGGDGLVEHYIISLRADEELLEHFEEAVEILLEGLGLENCPAVAAVHLDTDNPHIHVMVTRIDVDTGEPVSLPQYDLLRAHQLLAIMEDRFGWRRETDARWEVRDGRLIGDDGAIDLGPADHPEKWPDENYSRANSAQAKPKASRENEGLLGAEIIRRVVPDLVKRHSEVGPFLADLGSNGIELAMTGSNASYRITYVDDDGRTATENVRPSVVRKWSTAQLTDRFDALPEKFGANMITAQKVSRTQLDRIRYVSEKAGFQNQMNRVSSALRKALGSPVAEQIAAARSACAFPSFEEWMAGARPSDPAELLVQSTDTRAIGSVADGRKNLQLEVVDDDHFKGRRFGAKVIYTQKFAGNSPTRITDCGDIVVITGPPSDAAITLSLRLLKDRGAEAVSAKGFSRQDRARVSKIAEQMGLELVEPKRGQAPQVRPLRTPENAERLANSPAPTEAVPKRLPDPKPVEPPKGKNLPSPQPSLPSAPTVPTPGDKPAKPARQSPWPIHPGVDWGR